MRKKLVFFGTGILLLIIIARVIFLIYQPHHNAGSETALYTYSADSLYNFFQNDEALANQKLSGKIISVSGIISNTSKSDQYISVFLKTQKDGSINCSFLRTDLNENLFLGAKVTIKGKCTGYLMDVNLVDCVLIK